MAEAKAHWIAASKPTVSPCNDNLICCLDNQKVDKYEKNK